MTNEVTTKLIFTRVKVFGFSGWTYGQYKKPMFGPIKAGLRMARIAAEHAAKGFEVVYTEYRDPHDMSDTDPRVKQNVYADCTITNPLST